MGEANINEDARTLDNCLHQYCKDCKILKKIIQLYLKIKKNVFLKI